MIPTDAGVRRRLTLRFGPVAEAWCDALPAVLAELAGRWDLTVGAAIPRGSMSAVYRCRLSDGRPAVLKASPDRARLAVETAALRAWRTPHAPAVLAYDEGHGALLLDAVDPGTPLALVPEPPAPERVAALMASLHGAEVAGFPPVVDRIAHLFRASRVLYDRHPDSAAVVPPDLYERGRRLATRLAADPARTVLLHGDLTPGNVLDGGTGRGLVAIDPAPCVGDPAFDGVDLLLWRAYEVATVTGRADRIAAAGGPDAGRLVAWCVAFAGMVALELAGEPDADRRRLDTLLALASRA